MPVMGNIPGKYCSISGKGTQVTGFCFFLCPSHHTQLLLLQTACAGADSELQPEGRKRQFLGRVENQYDLLITHDHFRSGVCFIILLGESLFKACVALAKEILL